MLFASSKYMYMSQITHTLKSLKKKGDRFIKPKHIRKREETPTGGLTNQAVSQSSSTHLFFTYRSTSLPALWMRISSSLVGGSDLISLSIVTPHSASLEILEGRLDSDGGGRSFPVKPHKPSWLIRALIVSATRSEWYIGIFVHISVCSTSVGTEGPM